MLHMAYTPEPFCDTAAALKMAQTLIWLITTMADTYVEQYSWLVECLVWVTLGCNLKVVCHVVKPFKQDHRDTAKPLLLHIKSCNNTVTANCSCQMLQKLHSKTMNKCYDKFKHGILLHRPTTRNWQCWVLTQFHVTWGVRTFHIQLRLIATWFSKLWTSKQSLARPHVQSTSWYGTVV
jgi:hypothetical protein